ncbi:pleckstrin domain-containing protein [Heterostelium album PN500]|uniref:Pleckstrin domain-containing protein n=1 Tax=Heterostelium pallidum (strain ATCC 26659 / Pp 5 / PN500) TaxID=670386 RepID=D3B144_HETP5|nr:pleckstrin domain-containing protein [Heterostelium album PN500]EFA85018.1 pleckstrin domain-containing protein [Heterostelium album PN500]|eukprot:XP_020437128.1 pleckstrin domain-containing protein [Heterostelium album PN500]
MTTESILLDSDGGGIGSDNHNKQSKNTISSSTAMESTSISTSSTTTTFSNSTTPFIMNSKLKNSGGDILNNNNNISNDSNNNNNVAVLNNPLIYNIKKSLSTRRMINSLPSSHRQQQLQSPLMSTIKKVDPNLKRFNILKEILSTEQAYNSFLSVLIDVYLTGLRGSSVLSSEDIDTIFSNIEAIKSANDEILYRLKDRLENIEMPTQSTLSSSGSSESPEENNSQIVVVSDIFIELGPFLKIYSIFVNNYYSKAIKFIKNQNSNNKKFKTFLNECKYSQSAKKLDLNDLLIMPIQRLPRYILLLEELTQYTQNSQEKQNLIDAKQIMKEVASYVNQATERKGTMRNDQISLAHIQQLLGPKAANLIQPHRKLVKSGELDRLVVNSEGVPKKRKLIVYLFNDIIIYSVNNKFWRQMQLSEVWIKSRTNESYKSLVTFEIFSPSLSCIFLSDDNNMEWPLLIEDTINSLLENDAAAKEKRLKILENIQEQEDLTFEEKQFFFESLSSLSGNTVNQQSSQQQLHHQKNSALKGKHIRKQKSRANLNGIIESGIVNDRKKQIEQLLIEKRSILEYQGRAGMGADASEGAPSGEHRGDTGNYQDYDDDYDQDDQLLDDLYLKSIEYNEKKNQAAIKKYKTLSTSMPSSISAKSFFKEQPNRLDHIIMLRTNVKKQGYLTKIGHIVKNWKRRWFVMENGYLFYMKHQESNRQLGTIAILGSNIEMICYESRSFHIVTKGRTFMLVADSEDDLRDWLRVIQEFFDERTSNIQRIKSQFLSGANKPLSQSAGELWLSASPKASSSPTSPKHTPFLNSSLDGSNTSLLANSRSLRNQITTNSSTTTSNFNTNSGNSDSSVLSAADILRRCTILNNDNNNNNNHFEGGKDQQQIIESEYEDSGSDITISSDDEDLDDYEDSTTTESEDEN